MIFVRDIQARVASEYRIPLWRMREPDRSTGSREPDNARPRQVAMLLADRLTNHSRPKIGQLFGNRDHSTVFHACAVTQRRSQTDPELHNTLRRITLELVAR